MLTSAYLLKLQALHLALASELSPARPIVMRSLAYAAELERLMLMPEHAALLMDGGGGARIRRRLIRLAPTACALVAEGSELSVVR